MGKDIIKDIKNEIKKSRGVVKKRMKEFERIGKSEYKTFSELCFCILTANYTAEGGIKIQQKIEKDFFISSEEEIAKKLKNLGYRFPNIRAKYIVEARRHRKKLNKILRLKEKEARDILVKEVKGIGYKEASHFLRNCGKKDVAIIDFHIINLLLRYGIIRKSKVKSLGKKRYEEIEKKLERIAKKVGISLGELDLYLWAMETGKVLK